MKQAEFDFTAPMSVPIPGLKRFAFSGDDYDPSRDKIRLTGQILRIYDLMKDEHWRTLSDIASKTNDPEASISAQLRNLRKKQFGSHIVNRRHVGNPENGLYEYQLITNGERLEETKKTD